MEGWVLIVEPSRLARGALVAEFEHRAYRVIAVESAPAAMQLPRRFGCGIFSNAIGDTSSIGVAGWLLVERRIASAVFFGLSEDADLRQRACNLGIFVDRRAGLRRLEQAVRETMTKDSRYREPNDVRHWILRAQLATSG